MEKIIKIMTDSASDIPRELEQKYNIDIIRIHVTVGEKAFKDRDITNEEFYELITSSNIFPTHSQITAFEFGEIYSRYYAQGCTDLIYVALASNGSNTFSAAQMARDTFFEENPQAKETFNIHILDSGNYTGVQGYPVVQAAIKLSKGAGVDEIISYINDWATHAQVVFGCYTLEFVKRSGRVSTAAAFVGEMLGLRPILKIKHGISSTLAKVRGDKAVIPKIVETTAAEIIPQTPYCLVYGLDYDARDELEKEISKKLGYPPEMSFQVGAAVASNVGPYIVGVVFKQKD